jgi:hypothetical protein
MDGRQRSWTLHRTIWTADNALVDDLCALVQNHLRQRQFHAAFAEQPLSEVQGGAAGAGSWGQADGSNPAENGAPVQRPQNPRGIQTATKVVGAGRVLEEWPAGSRGVRGGSRFLGASRSVTGIMGREAVRIVTVQMMGEAALMVYRDGQGKIDSQILFRDKEAELKVVPGGRKWSFEGNGDQFRLVSEAERIRLVCLFDPCVAVNGSAIDPLPHQISAVYEHMLPRQPMRFPLADDPGAEKTVMAGLLIKELLIRGELKRCLIVAPGSLSEQWQVELKEKFESTSNCSPMT